MNALHVIGLIGVVLLWMRAGAAEEPNRIDARVLAADDTVVVGRLGHPLGTVVVVEATLGYREGIDLGPAYPRVREYHLLVHRVNGVDLPAPARFPYHNVVGSRRHGLPDANITIPAREQQLSEEALFWKGVREESPDTRHILFVHEEAEFSGLPRNLPPGLHARLSGEWIFGFFSRLAVHHEDAVTRFTTGRGPGGLRYATWPGRAPADCDEFYRGVWSATLDSDPWITTQPEALVRIMRAEFVAAAGREGGPAATVEPCFEAWAAAARARVPLAVPATMILMAEDDPPSWVIVWKEFRWSDDPARGEQARAQPTFGAIRWAIYVADHCTVIRAGDAQVLREFELYRVRDDE
ncbi:MAG: hypothetical protein IAE82_04580 [Opitutaceae bacterium]|nr:hypothetical protein [Opitutaceae bacterium]